MLDENMFRCRTNGKPNIFTLRIFYVMIAVGVKISDNTIHSLAVETGLGMLFAFMGSEAHGVALSCVI